MKVEQSTQGVRAQAGAWLAGRIGWFWFRDYGTWTCWFAARWVRCNVFFNALQNA